MKNPDINIADCFDSIKKLQAFRFEQYFGIFGQNCLHNQWGVKRPRNNCQFVLIKGLSVILNPKTLRDAVLKKNNIFDRLLIPVFCDNDDKGCTNIRKDLLHSREKGSFPARMLSVLSEVQSVKER